MIYPNSLVAEDAQSPSCYEYSAQRALHTSVGVVGCGYWGKNLVQTFHNIGGLAMVCDSSPAGRKTAQQIAPKAPQVSFEQLINSDVAGVIIATPAATHYDLAKRALLAGKDVMVEKPLALSYEEGAELVRRAEEHGRILMVGHVLAYHTGFMRLLALVRSGELGHLRYICANHLNLGQIRTEENVMWSCAPHGIGLILSLTDTMPIGVTATGTNQIQPHIADVVIVNLTFPQGLHAHVHANWLYPYKDRRLVVIGEKRSACFDDVDNTLTLYNQQVEWDGEHPRLRQTDMETIKFPDMRPLQRQCCAFLAAIQTRCPPLTDGHYALKVISVLQTAQRSLEANGVSKDCGDENQPIIQ